MVSYYPKAVGILSLHGVVFDILVFDGGGRHRAGAGSRAAHRRHASIQPPRRPFAAVKIPFGNPALTMISVWLGA
jgi:hypothetical protein